MPQIEPRAAKLSYKDARRLQELEALMPRLQAEIKGHERTLEDAGLYARDPKRFDHRCPTTAVRIKGHTPLELATRLGERGFFTWDGNYYALNLTERLDVEKDGGFLRIGLAHYNTADEVEQLLAALREIVS